MVVDQEALGRREGGGIRRGFGSRVLEEQLCLCKQFQISGSDPGEWLGQQSCLRRQVARESHLCAGAAPCRLVQPFLWGGVEGGAVVELRLSFLFVFTDPSCLQCLGLAHLWHDF